MSVNNDDNHSDSGRSAHAMEKVLDQLGPDAYILESRKDGNRFQIRATDDPKNVIPKAPATPRAPVSASKGRPSRVF